MRIAPISSFSPVSKQHPVQAQEAASLHFGGIGRRLLAATLLSAAIVLGPAEPVGGRAPSTSPHANTTRPFNPEETSNHFTLMFPDGQLPEGYQRTPGTTDTKASEPQTLQVESDGLTYCMGFGLGQEYAKFMLAIPNSLPVENACQAGRLISDALYFMAKYKLYTEGRSPDGIAEYDWKFSHDDVRDAATFFEKYSKITDLPYQSTYPQAYYDRFKAFLQQLAQDPQMFDLLASIGPRPDRLDRFPRSETPSDRLDRSDMDFLTYIGADQVLSKIPAFIDVFQRMFKIGTQDAKGISLIDIRRYKQYLDHPETITDPEKRDLYKKHTPEDPTLRAQVQAVIEALLNVRASSGFGNVNLFIGFSSIGGNEDSEPNLIDHQNVTRLTELHGFIRELMWQHYPPLVLPAVFQNERPTSGLLDGSSSSAQSSRPAGRENPFALAGRASSRPSAYAPDQVKPQRSHPKGSGPRS